MNQQQPTSKKAVCLALVLILIAGLGPQSCGSSGESIDRSVLTGLPCAAPCWQGITPGVTTRAQSLAILEGSRYVRSGSVRESGTAQRGGVVWEEPVRWRHIQPGLWWKDDIVQEITLDIAYDLSVEQVVGKFGPPEAINAGRGGVPEHYYWIVILYYPQIGAEFRAFTEEFSDLLETSTIIAMADYFIPTSLEGRIRAVNIDYTSYEKIVAHEMSTMRPWKGYGDLFQVYYKSPGELAMP